MKLEKLKSLEAKLTARKEMAKANKHVTVGYSASYALIQHENLDYYHEVGQAKYLEQPAREMQGELAQEVVDTFKKTKDLTKSLFRAGLKLQRASQLLVPVDTGALKASAFTEVRDGK